MYTADPDPVLRAVAGLTAPGGMASLLVRNGDGLAMRPGLLGNWAACAQALSISGDSVTYANRIGVTARADRLADLTARLAGHGLESPPGTGCGCSPTPRPATPIRRRTLRPCWPGGTGRAHLTPTGRWPPCCM